MVAHISRFASARRFPSWLRLALVPPVAAIVLAGIWVTGGLLTNNFRLSMLFTTLWLGLVGLSSLVVAWRWRPLALPVLGTAFVAAAAAGGYLLYASSVDKVVNEQVAVAENPPSSAPTTGDEPDEPAPPANVALGRGAFTSGEHETSGTATVIRLAKGGSVLTLTSFETSPGSRPPRLPRHRRARRSRRRRRPRRAQGQQRQPAVRGASLGRPETAPDRGHLVPRVQRRLRQRSPRVTATAAPRLTRMLYELARRDESGLVVRLLWDRRRDQAVIRYRDRRNGEAFAADVPNRKALDAFRHPNVYRPGLAA